MRAPMDELRPYVRTEEGAAPGGDRCAISRSCSPDAARSHPGAGHGAHRRRRRPRHLSGVEEDDLRGGGRSPGSKREKAERLGVPILDEAGLLALLDS